MSNICDTCWTQFWSCRHNTGQRREDMVGCWGRDKGSMIQFTKGTWITRDAGGNIVSGSGWVFLLNVHALMSCQCHYVITQKSFLINKSLTIKVIIASCQNCRVGPCHNRRKVFSIVWKMHCWKLLELFWG